jgi:hypothetical protein
MLGYSKNYSNEDQKMYCAWADFYTVFRIFFWLQFPEGCNGKKEFHDAKKIGNGQEQPL